MVHLSVAITLALLNTNIILSLNTEGLVSEDGG